MLGKGVSIFKMKTYLDALLMAAVLQTFVKVVSSYPAQEPFALTEAHDDLPQPQKLEEKGYNPFFGRKVLDKGRYILEWLVDHEEKFITFNITCRTTGWVGLGLSKNGLMRKADIVIAGFNISNGEFYIENVFTDYDRKLHSDLKPHWRIVSASEEQGFTFLQVKRPFDSCDTLDYPITMDLLWVIWAYGETDNVHYHFGKRGSFRVYLLDPIIQTQEKPLKKWELRNTVTLTGKRTTYVCTIHRAPPLLIKKHSIVELHAYMENEIALEHTHHIVFYRCVSPPGILDDIFLPWTFHPGEECYFDRLHVMPMMLCKIVIHVWAVGGDPLVLPQSVGFPLGDSLFGSEYYMLEMHYNNPLGYSGVTFTSGLDIYYTDEPRPNDAGNLFIFYDPVGVFMVPPISTHFEVYAYCTPNCTGAMIPKSGVEIVGVQLHGHLSAKKVRLQHYRDGKQLGIILKDDNYDSTFQPSRILYEPRLLLPNDQLVVSCEHENTWTNTTTLSGFATFEEMCTAVLTLKKRIPYFICASQIPQDILLPLIGVQHVEWDLETQGRRVTSPATLAGKSLQFVADELTKWDESLRNLVQNVTLTGKQIGMCPQVLAPASFDNFEDMIGIIITVGTKLADFLKLANGYGTDTLLGFMQLPTRTPGPLSDPIQEGVKYHIPPRTCQKSPSPFTAAIPIGNSFNGQAIGRTAPGYLHYRQPFIQYIDRKH